MFLQETEKSRRLALDQPLKADETVLEQAVEAQRRHGVIGEALSGKRQPDHDPLASARPHLGRPLEPQRPVESLEIKEQ